MLIIISIITIICLLSLTLIFSAFFASAKMINNGENSMNILLFSIFNRPKFKNDEEVVWTTAHINSVYKNSTISEAIPLFNIDYKKYAWTYRIVSRDIRMDESVQVSQKNLDYPIEIRRGLIIDELIPN